MPDTPPISNTPENLDMVTILSIASKYGGLAKTCRYIVRILPRGPRLMQKVAQSNLRGFEDLAYMCEAAEIPGRGFQNIDVRYYGPSFKMPVLSQFEDVSMTFLCRSESLERKFFDDWMEIINPSNTWNFAYRDSYTAEIQIYQLTDYAERKATDDNKPNSYTADTNRPKATYQWSLLDSYPLVINPQAVTWADDNYQRITVAFTYSRWTRPTMDNQRSSAFRQPGTFINSSTSSLNPLPLPKTGL